MSRKVGIAIALVASALAAGSEQVAASAEQVTITIRPAILRANESASASGFVSSGKALEQVTLQFKQCGLYPVQFREVAETTTDEAGGWAMRSWIPPAGGVFRAGWRGAVSEEVAVQRRPWLELRRLPRGTWEIVISAALPFYRKHVLLQRFDQRRRSWATIKTFVLTKQPGGGGPEVRTSTDEFRISVPRGTTLRAHLPLTAARPCYLAGYSRLVRT